MYWQNQVPRNLSQMTWGDTVRLPRPHTAQNNYPSGSASLKVTPFLGWPSSRPHPLWDTRPSPAEDNPEGRPGPSTVAPRSLARAAPQLNLPPQYHLAPPCLTPNTQMPPPVQNWLPGWGRDSLATLCSAISAHPRTSTLPIFFPQHHTPQTFLSRK